MLKRIFDIFFGCLAALVLLLPAVIVAVVVKMTSKGPILYLSDRIGLHGAVFKMPKFRTMVTDSPAVATHLLQSPGQYLTPVGHFLRRTSLDELPQLISIVKGDMSFVGPRPALYNQEDLISLRREKQIDSIRPGLTGWAQINGRDDLSIEEKVVFDQYYLLNRSLLLDIRIILETAVKVVKRAGVSH